MAKRWNVMLPVTGQLSVEVEAESEKEAIRKALDTPYEEGQHDLQWETTELVVGGNVFYGMLSRAEAEELEPDEDE